MNIYIDTSVYLGFYELGDKGKVEPFEQLQKLIKSKQIKILMPEQVKDEFFRRRGSLAALYLKHLDEKIKLLQAYNIPALAPCLSHWKDYKKKKAEFEDSITKAIKVINEIRELYIREIDDDKNQINHMIETIFSLSEPIVVDNSILEKAKWRRFKGNPPGKEGSNGDAINWEALLSYGGNVSLTIVSYDRDWFSPLKESPNEYIEKEWKERKKSKLTIASSLGEAINEISQKAAVSKKAIDAEKQIRDQSKFFYINDLMMSGTGMHVNPYVTLDKIFSDKDHGMIIPQNYFYNTDVMGKMTPMHWPAYENIIPDDSIPN